MMGMEMLLQSFGVNPDEVKQNVDNAVKLVQLMNEQLANIKETLDRIEAKSGRQQLMLESIEDHQIRLYGELQLLNEWTRRDEWPPTVTQTLDELKETQEVAVYGGRQQGISSGSTGETGRKDTGAGAKDAD